MDKADFKYIISLLVERGGEAAKAAKDNPESAFESGRSMGYWEALDTIKNRLTVAGEDLKDYGLDFDLEKTFL